MKIKKGGIPIQFLISLVLGILLFAGASAVFSNILFHSEYRSYEKSFNDFSNFLHNFDNRKETVAKDSFNLKMQDESFLFIFKEGSQITTSSFTYRDIIEEKTVGMPLINSKKNLRPDFLIMSWIKGNNLFFKKPLNHCSETESCMCLCSGFFNDISSKLYSTYLANTYTYDLNNYCDILKCKKTNYNSQILDNEGFEGGYIIERHSNFVSKEEREKTLIEDTNARAIYANKISNQIKLCYDPPCFKENE